MQMQVTLLDELTLNLNSALSTEETAQDLLM